MMLKSQNNTNSKLLVKQVGVLNERKFSNILIIGLEA